jgi:hypothetical protein
MSSAGAKKNDDVGPYFRDRATHYRMMAAKASSSRLDALYRELADAFDRDAEIMEKHDDGYEAPISKRAITNRR